MLAIKGLCTIFFGLRASGLEFPCTYSNDRRIDMANSNDHFTTLVSSLPAAIATALKSLGYDLGPRYYPDRHFTLNSPWVHKPNRFDERVE